ncbi:MAG TPA: peptide chain release factor N(5)-glutamine methyltransferase [candidate division Zixibacteria bacterium]|nr:peptide chain release factor N(5)-glutamine methyltransferase [candidate division Zixibacteria bacterium]
MIGPAASVRGLLAEGGRRLAAAGIESALLDAELLLGEALGWTKERLCTDRNARVRPEERFRYEQLIGRRLRREPLAYIVGRKEFWSLEFRVTPSVLVPRPETELLVEIAVVLASSLESERELRVLDIGTGAGVIAVAVAKEISRARVWATDISEDALEVARDNARRHGVADRIRLARGDLFGALDADAGPFHLIVSNPPYVRRSDIAGLAPEIADWEPRVALDGGADGLDFYRRIFDDARGYLAQGGFLALEIGSGMAGPVGELIESARVYGRPAVYRDSSGLERVLVARRPTAET